MTPYCRDALASGETWCVPGRLTFNRFTKFEKRGWTMSEYDREMVKDAKIPRLSDDDASYVAIRFSYSDDTFFKTFPVRASHAHLSYDESAYDVPFSLYLVGVDLSNYPLVCHVIDNVFVWDGGRFVHTHPVDYFEGTR